MLLCGCVAVYMWPYVCMCMCVCMCADTAVRMLPANLRRNPLTERYYTALAALQQVTGKGAAPLLRDIPNVVAGGFLDGGIEAGGSLAERLLMELGGDMTVGWGRVADPMVVYNIVNVHSIDRYVGVVVPEIQSQEGASITEHVVNALADGQPGTQVGAWMGVAGSLAQRANRVCMTLPV